MKRSKKYKQRLHIPSPQINAFYFQLERNIHPNYHKDNHYDYLMPLWKVACQLFRWGLNKQKQKQHTKHQAKNVYTF